MEGLLSQLFYFNRLSLSDNGTKADFTTDFFAYLQDYEPVKTNLLPNLGMELKER